MRLVIAALLTAAALAVSPVRAGDVEDARAQKAVAVLKEVQSIPESAIPDKLLDEAHAIIIIPDTVKASLIFGGRRGHGLMSVRMADGAWSPPAFVTLTGGSVGLQFGIQSADVVLVFRNEAGIQDLVNGTFTLGADAGLAAGPVGRNASTATDGRFEANVWSWSRARGLFAGVALDGAVLKINDDANQSAYGQGSTPRMIFEGRAATLGSNSLIAMRDALEEATALARARRAQPEPAKPVTPTTEAPAATPAPATQKPEVTTTPLKDGA